MNALRFIRSSKGKRTVLRGTDHSAAYRNGNEVVDTDGWPYRLKRGVDVVVETAGQKCGLELKYDLMSERTGNVAVDLDSIDKPTSAIWIYGLPNGGRIEVYTMQIKDLAPFARNYPIKAPAGELRRLCALIPKSMSLSYELLE